MSILGGLRSLGCRGGRKGVQTGCREGEKEARAGEVSGDSLSILLVWQKLQPRLTR